MLMKMRSKMQNQKGFTLVELMVVVVILGVLVAIAVPIYNNVSDNAKEKACESNMRIIVGAGESYKAVKNVYPADIATLKTDGYLQSTPECPSGGNYTYNSTYNTITCDKTGHALPNS